MKQFLSIVVLAAAAGTALAGPFTAGNLVVYRAGDGSGALGNAAAAAFLDEYTPSGTLVQSVALPTSVSGSNRRVTISGSASSEGQLTRSADGRYLAFVGYDAAPGTASIATSTSATVNRVIARVGMDGVVDSSTITTAFSGNAIRAAATDDGSRFWVTGGTNGVQFAQYGVANAANQINTGTGASTNNRAVNIFGGQLYVSSASTALRGVGAIGSGLPSTTGQATTLLAGTNSNTSSSGYDFAIVSSSLMYMADDSAVAGLGGLQRWELVAGTWTRTQTWAPANGGRIRQLVNTTTANGDNLLYVTVVDSANVTTIQSLVDVGAGSSFNVIATGATNTAFRGIEFAPIPTPGSLALLGLAGLAAGRRRR